MSGSKGYRDTVTIRPDSSAGGTGEPDYSGSATITGMPCKITTIGGDTTYRGRMLEARTSHVVEMQYIAGVTHTARLEVTGGIHVGKNLNISSVRIVEGNSRARKLELYCDERAGR
jgi:hypothetical protein